MSLAHFLQTAETKNGRVSAEQLDGAFAEVMDGKASLEDTKRFLEATCNLMKVPNVIVAGARAMRSRMVPVKAPEGAIDVCGTGGDGAHTLNISTAVAFVVAGAGVPVAKHGNRAMSSKSGAADVLEAIGVKLTGDVPTLERALREAGIAFLFAQNHHPAMRHVAAARKELGKRTIFNLLGPLSNPAGVKRQLVGVFAEDYIRPLAEALDALGSEHVWVVHGHGGLDELSCEGANAVGEMHGFKARFIKVSPADAHVSQCKNSDVRGGTAQENALALRALLNGEMNGSSYHETVQLNAGAALVVAGKASTIAEGAKLAFESIHQGRARHAMDLLIDITRAAPEKTS